MFVYLFSRCDTLTDFSERHHVASEWAKTYSDSFFSLISFNSNINSIDP